MYSNTKYVQTRRAHDSSVFWVINRRKVAWKRRFLDYLSVPSWRVKCPWTASVIPSSGLIGGLTWFETDVSGLPIGSVFKGQGTWNAWILPSSGLIRGLTWFETDVSGLPIGLIFKGQDSLDNWPLMGPIGSPETAVLNHITPPNNPEDGRIYFNRGESQRSRAEGLNFHLRHIFVA